MKLNRKEYLKIIKEEYGEEYYNKCLYEEYVESIRNITTSAFRRKNYKKTTKTYELLGCDFKTLNNHIRKQFTKGMSWENHTLNGWHIDHIVPLKIAKNKKDIIELSHYTNLQPLWSSDNMKKGGKLYPVSNLFNKKTYI